MHTTGHTFADFDALMRAQYWASLALRHTRGLGPRSITRLLNFFGSAHEALQHIPQWVEAGVASHRGAEAATGSWRVTAQEEWNNAQKNSVHILLWHDALYPELLRRLPDAPVILYAKGDMQLLTAPCVAVIGARNCTQEGMRVTRDIAQQLSQSGVTVVSGMAQGVDSVAHIAALVHVGKSIGVLGAGIDIQYPICNKDIYRDMYDNGLIITEFAPHTPPLAQNFPIRNRLISGISLGILVVEAALRSGSLVTARLALEQNREVYAIPGPTGMYASVGCQELIRQGARAVFNAQDILHDLMPALHAYGIRSQDISQQEVAPAQPKPKLSKPHSSSPPKTQNKTVTIDATQEAGRVLQFLSQKDPCYIDAVGEHLNMPIQRVSSLLVELEVLGHIVRVAGGRYALSPHLAQGFTVTHTDI